MSRPATRDAATVARPRASPQSHDLTTGDRVLLHLLEYQLVEDYLQRREQFRADHLTLLRQAQSAGALVLAGAVSDPADRSLLAWSAPRDVVEAFVQRDPYVANGLVRAWSIRRWNVVVGSAAEVAG